jgi:hypothetical protein
MKFKRTLVAVVGMISLSHAANAQDTTQNKIERGAKKVDVDVKKNVFDAMDKDAITVDFDAGVTAVSDGEKRDLKALVQSLDRSTKNYKVAIASWSDQDYPLSAKLPDAQEALATERAKNIRTYLQSLRNFKEVTVYNMAKQDSKLGRFFNTEDAKVKGAYKGAEGESADVEFVGRRLQDKGGKSKAVVIFYDAKTVVNG